MKEKREKSENRLKCVGMPIPYLSQVIGEVMKNSSRMLFANVAADPYPMTNWWL